MFLKKSMYGRAITAVRSNAQMAMSVGISVNKIYLLVFGIGSCLAGLAAILYSLNAVAVPNMGISVILTGFVTVFFGGTNSIPGAALGGMIIGLVTSYSSLFVTADFAPVIVFGLLYVVLILKPNGLLGKRR
jgi:branched-chain amino acid transport system permease protein